MNNVATLKRRSNMMNLSGEAEIPQILERLEKLSKRPEDPGMAYRNLEMINALIGTLRGKLEPDAKTGT